MVKQKTVQNFVNRFDIYGSSIPAFNFEKDKSIGSLPGLFCSILTVILFFLYASKKLQMLTAFNDPLVSTIIEESAFSDSDGMNLHEEKLKIAFLVTDYSSNQEKSDPNFVSWEVNIVESDGNMHEIKSPIGIHKCNSTDVNEFYPSTIKSKNRWHLIKE